LAVASLASASENQEARLYKYLLAAYNPLVRPVKDYSQNVSVAISHTIFKLDPFCHDRDLFSATMWPFLQWKDDYLKWDAEDFGGIGEIRLPIEKIWLPDVFVFNSLESMDLRNSPKSDVVVYKDGTVIWITHQRFKTICKQQKETEFQNCTITLGSWVFKGTLMDVTMPAYGTGVDTSLLVENKCWKLLSSKAEREEKLFAGIPDVYPRINVNFRFQKTC
jgi:hypothetical protein